MTIPTTRYTGAELADRATRTPGHRPRVAGIPGGAVLPLYDALARSRRIRHVLARHEQGAGFIAQGMARVTGRPGVCIASSGPGATNLLTAIADAKLDSIPLVAITGQVPRAMIGTDAFQEVDTFGLSLPDHEAQLPRDGGERLAARHSGSVRDRRLGPAGAGAHRHSEGRAERDRRRRRTGPRPRRTRVRRSPPPTDLERAAAMIEAAERPILYSAAASCMPERADAARAVAERSALPTVMTLMGLGALPTRHELSLGMLGMHAAPYTNLALDESDLLVAVGARFDDRATGKLAEFCPHAAVIHIDVDAARAQQAAHGAARATRRCARGPRAPAAAAAAAPPPRVARAHRRAQVRAPAAHAAARLAAQPVRPDARRCRALCPRARS